MTDESQTRSVVLSQLKKQERRSGLTLFRLVLGERAAVRVLVPQGESCQFVCCAGRPKKYTIRD